MLTDTAAATRPHRFRPSARPRNRFRPQCRPANGALEHWLLPPRKSTAATPAPAVPGREPAPSSIPPEFRAIFTNNPGIPNTPTEPNPPEGSPRLWQMEMSHIEWAVLNALPGKYPDAWKYLMDVAFQRGGLRRT